MKDDLNGGINVNKHLYTVLILLFCAIFIVPFSVMAEDNEEDKPEPQSIETPESAMNISKENTYPNPTQDLPELQPSELAERLLQSTEVTIENHDLLKMLNE